MNRSIIFSLFIATAAVQLFVPASLILRRESVIKHGSEYMLLAAPVDPYDAFRGRYVRIAMDTVTRPLPLGQSFDEGKKAFAVLEKGSDGVASVKSISYSRPEGTDYLTVNLRNVGSGNVAIVWPFDRYYMEEFMAPEAERLYWEKAGEHTAHIIVRVFKGMGVVTGLYVDGKPIEEQLSQRYGVHQRNQ